MTCDLDFRTSPLAVSASVAASAATLDAARLVRLREALRSVAETIGGKLDSLPRDKNLVVLISDIAFLVRFHRDENRFYVCAFVFETDDNPDPKSPAAATQPAHDWIGDTVVCDNTGIRPIASLLKKPKVFINFGYSEHPNGDSDAKLMIGLDMLVSDDDASLVIGDQTTNFTKLHDFSDNLTLIDRLDCFQMLASIEFSWAWHAGISNPLGEPRVTAHSDDLQSLTKMRVEVLPGIICLANRNGISHDFARR